jgi:endoglucanase
VGAVSLQIPESDNGVPDLLDEARWNLRWMLKMQDADGGVWHKLTSERFGGFVMPEKDDGGPRYVIGTGSAPFKSSCATGDFAAVMAIAARVFRPFDPEFARTALAAAERAWAWLAKNPAVVFRNCCGVQTGEYGDGNCADERLWAAAELFRATGAPEYDSLLQVELRHGRARARGRTALVAGRAQPRPVRLRPLAPAHDGRGRALPDPHGRGRRRRRHRGRTRANPYRLSLRATDYVWGSNGVVANYGVALVLVNMLQPDPALLDAAAENLHYLLGRNTFALSWVTQLGDRPYRHPHHRPSGGDANAEPWPGMLSGGPNRYGGDPVIDALPATPPARRYRDDQGSYASNEMAINWNAPLVFLLASLLPEPGALTFWFSHTSSQ